MGVPRDALAVQERAIKRSDRAAAISVRLWRQMDADDLDGSWERVGPRVEQATSAVVAANLAGASGLTNKLARTDGMAGDALLPEAFAGVDGSGRSLGGALRGAVVTTKQAIGVGTSIADAMIAGGSYLALMVKSAIADLERSGSMTAATGKGYVRYVRLVNPGACSRCAILAGSDRFSSDFQRHPACRCSTVPVRDGAMPSGFITDPSDYFDSLSPAEQERVFTKAGAEAIRAGADPVAVVNARSGANRKPMSGVTTYKPTRIQRSVIGRGPDGQPILGYVTSAGTSRRGSYGRTQERLGASVIRGSGRYSTVTRPRLMPESIIALTDDVETRRLLLRDAGYLRPDARVSTRDRWAQQQRDKSAADAFYRSKGIGVA